ncbi:adenosylcobinamide-GDP ribazoletransferase [Massilia antarctica]|uniref:adenosylcobinamide-GDP ribazoletransferase n=1 Tax=Massilia antarctica TaxID=2765360 RepID=UPI00226FA81A|nr:adenosylcobinamide-GDP ribazoletransferase [Massilia sp. H27-R4]MCY0916416.1 adenosylcobinamide-GDP ribazoletransferase [Massilia sp. H27-R4]
MASIVHQCRLFFIALQFFTRVPIPGWVGFDPAWLHHASRYFPLVGVVVAGAAAAVYACAAWLWPAPVAVLLSTAAAIYLTGAFHEDGLADMCDGFGGGLSTERVLEIMKDSRIGTYGAVGMGLTVALKCSLLSFLPASAVITALFIAHPLSRLAAVSLIWEMEYARAEGKAKPMAQHMSNREFGIACACAGGPALVLATAGLVPWLALLTGVMGAALVAWWLGAKCLRRIGGYTGDCLGAVQQVAEVAIYLALLAFFHHGLWG